MGNCGGKQGKSSKLKMTDQEWKMNINQMKNELKHNQSKQQSMKRKNSMQEKQLAQNKNIQISEQNQDFKEKLQLKEQEDINKEFEQEKQIQQQELSRHSFSIEIQRELEKDQNYMGVKKKKTISETQYGNSFEEIPNKNNVSIIEFDNIEIIQDKQLQEKSITIAEMLEQLNSNRQ